ncbi:sensor domain-containing diguanylate cyclase [Chitinimonas naiadis]
MAASLPQNEAARLEALNRYAILDTLEERAYDDITYLASHICQVPIAAISLIAAERQWLKSKVGLDASEMAREFSFCSHAILNPGEVMVVNDATHDHRFQANPMVLGDPHIRFYAGAPLVTAEGEALGTICVVDRIPRKIDAREQAALQALSRQVMAQLELRRLVAELDKLSSLDGLTGIFNRRALDLRLHEEYLRAERTHAALSYLQIDVDLFKSFNDTFGHLAGDEALQQVATVIKESARGYDFVARYGGEEFGVILPTTDRAGAIELAERVRQRIVEANWQHRPVTVSIGVATNPPERQAHGLLEQADQALYRAKQQGRNRVVHFGL